MAPHAGELPTEAPLKYATTRMCAHPGGRARRGQKGSRKFPSTTGLESAREFVGVTVGNARNVANLVGVVHKICQVQGDFASNQTVPWACGLELGQNGQGPNVVRTLLAVGPGSAATRASTRACCPSDEPFSCPSTSRSELCRDSWKY